MNRDKLELYFELKEKIENRILEIFNYININNIDKQKHIFGSLLSFELEGDIVYVKTIESLRRGGAIYHTNSLHVELITSDNWLDILKENVEKENKNFLNK